MPKAKDLKRRIRQRMQKTGESYTSARAQLLKRPPARTRPTASRDHAALAGMSDEAVQAKTGKDWAGWVRALDRARAAAWPHKEIARHLHGEHGLSGWWAQTVTVAYERIRGLREKGQRRDGGFDVNKSKTVPVPVSTLYAAFGARRRKRWLGEHALTIRKASVEKSLRITWEDGTPLDVYFWAKGPEKSQVQLQHRGLPSKAHADRVRAFWTERLARLADTLRETS